MESRPSPGRTASASRKRKRNEPEMFNLFSQENMYDEAVSQEEMTGEQAAAEAKWQERRLRFEEERKKKRNHVRLPEKYAPNTRTALS